MWEAEGLGRLGIEWYYTGRQSLEENPYRTVSEPLHDSSASWRKSRSGGCGCL